MVGPLQIDSKNDLAQRVEPEDGHDGAVTAVGQAYDALMAFVRSAPAGTRLPPERELAARFGVSRTTLRSATDRLELLGYLSVRHGSGTVTRRPGPERLALPFAAAIEDVPGSLHEIYALRLIVEPALAALAAKHATPEALPGLRVAAAGDDTHFHRLLADHGGNDSAAQVVGVLLGLSAGVRRSASDASRERVAKRQHEAVVDAVAAGDPSLARESLRLHLRWEARGLTADHG